MSKRETKGDDRELAGQPGLKLSDATGEGLEAIAKLSGCPGELVRQWWDEVMWGEEDGVPIPLVRTEPVLRDPRPLRVKVHGKTYNVHRVVHGQVLGCSRVDAQPGTILPPTLLFPTTIGIS